MTITWCFAYSGYYAARDDGARTRVYPDRQGAQRASARGEWYTEAEYAALVAPSAPVKRGKK